MTDTKPALPVGGKIAPIIPQSFDEAWRCAQVLAASGLAPSGIDTPEKVMAAIMAGAEIGMAPFQALQSFAIINGRPALWGDGMLAVVRGRGVRVTETLTGEGDDRVATCTVKRPDSDEEITRSFSVADAIRAGLWQTQALVKRKGKNDQWYEAKNDSPWYKYPQRMLQMRARAWAIRDGCADILRGVQMAEEAEDVVVVSNERIAPPQVTAPDNDQQPQQEPDEGPTAFIHGEAWSLVLSHYTGLFETADTVDDLDKIWASFKRKYWVGKRRCIANNSYDGIAEMYEGQVANRLRSAMCAIGSLSELEEWFATHEARLAPQELEIYEAKQQELIAEEAAQNTARSGASALEAGA